MPRRETLPGRSGQEQHDEEDRRTDVDERDAVEPGGGEDRGDGQRDRGPFRPGMQHEARPLGAPHARQAQREERKAQHREDVEKAEVHRVRRDEGRDEGREADGDAAVLGPARSGRLRSREKGHGQPAGRRPPARAAPRVRRRRWRGARRRRSASGRARRRRARRRPPASEGGDRPPSRARGRGRRGRTAGSRRSSGSPRRTAPRGRGGPPPPARPTSARGGRATGPWPRRSG